MPTLPTIVPLDGCAVDLVQMRVLRPGADTRLSQTEVALLSYLVARAHQVVSRDELHREVWGVTGTPAGRAVDHAVKRLRKKLERDPGQPRHLLSVRGQGYTFVPLNTLPTRPSRVVHDPARFVGRQAELADLDALWADGARLVVVKGPPGVGKTRLATEWALRQPEAAPGGVWLCDLSACRDADDATQAVAASLSLTLQGPDPAGDVGRALGARGRARVVLDNTEQLAGFEELLARWLDCAPQAGFVVTSQVASPLVAQVVLALEPLSQADAMELFFDRAQNVAPDLGAEVRPAVASLVEQLDRLPLAIELVAAWAGVYTPAQLSEANAARRGPAGAARHSSLQSALQASWDLLDSDQAALLSGCSVFVGGFTVEAAHEVVPLPVGSDHAALLADLVDRSLVVSRPGADGRRLSMLHTVYAFAARQRATHPDLDARLQVRHGQHYAGRVGDRGHGAVPERSNLEVALDRALVRADGACAAPLQVALSRLYLRGVSPGDWAQTTDRVLALPLSPRDAFVVRELRLRSAAIRGPCSFDWNAEAAALVASASELEVADQVRAALVVVARWETTGRPDLAVEATERGLRLLGAEAAPKLLFSLRFQRANALAELRDPKRLAAARQQVEGFAAQHEIPNAELLIGSLQLAQACLTYALPAVIEAAEALLSVARATAHRVVEAHAMSTLAHHHLHHGQLAAAEPFVAAGLDLMGAFDPAGDVQRVHIVQAELWLAQGRPDAALQLVVALRQRLRAREDRVGEVEVLRMIHGAGCARGSPDPQALVDAHDLARTFTDRWWEPLVRLDRLEWALELGDIDAALQLSCFDGSSELQPALQLRRVVLTARLARLMGDASGALEALDTTPTALLEGVMFPCRRIAWWVERAATARHLGNLAAVEVAASRARGLVAALERIPEPSLAEAYARHILQLPQSATQSAASDS